MKRTRTGIMSSLGPAGRLSLALAAPLLAGALQSPLTIGRPRSGFVSTAQMAIPDECRDIYSSGEDKRLEALEECIAELDAATDDATTFSKYMDQLAELKKEGLQVGSSEWAAAVAEAEQRTEAFRWASNQQAQQRGQAYLRDRDRAQSEATAGLEVGSRDWAVAMERASTESFKAYRVAEEQMAAAREAANRKRAALLEALFADGDGSGLATSLSTDAALDVLFGSGYDVEGGGGSALTKEDVSRMRGPCRSGAQPPGWQMTLHHLVLTRSGSSPGQASSRAHRRRSSATTRTSRCCCAAPRCSSRSASPRSRARTTSACAGWWNVQPLLHSTLLEDGTPLARMRPPGAASKGQGRRRDEERPPSAAQVLELEPANPEAQKYVERANYGAAFDPYEARHLALISP
jgi:hypothetical protein